LVTITFGPGATCSPSSGGGGRSIGPRSAPAATALLVPVRRAHNLANALAAIAIGEALEVPLDQMAQRASGITFSRLRGELVELADGIVIVNDCYNANPMSMRAALDHLASLAAPGRHVAVLGEMAELGPDAADYHREAGSHARQPGGPSSGLASCPRPRPTPGPRSRGGRAARRGDAPGATRRWSRAAVSASSCSPTS
jgi:UDP-N-acetylmuramoyl-tripeptide--D-alanyl-D-alanine ligase